MIHNNDIQCRLITCKQWSTLASGGTINLDKVMKTREEYQQKEIYCWNINCPLSPTSIPTNESLTKDLDKLRGYLTFLSKTWTFERPTTTICQTTSVIYQLPLLLNIYPCPSWFWLLTICLWSWQSSHIPWNKWLWVTWSLT